MRQKLTKLIIIILVILNIVGICGIAVQCIGYYKNYKLYSEACELVRLDELIRAHQKELENTAYTAEPTKTESADFINNDGSTDSVVLLMDINTEAEPLVPLSPEPLVEEPVKTDNTEQISESEIEQPIDLNEISDPYVRSLMETDISMLIQKNADVFGWIMIPDTTISYPLLQGIDNSFYLTHSFDGKWSAGGSIFIDYRVDKNLSDFHSIIYGHRMYSDAMFNALGKYEKQDFFEKHPSVYILADGVVRKYNIFSAYEADVKNGSSYRLGLTEVSGQQALFDYCKYYSVIDSDIMPNAERGDKLLTLSTCTAIGRKSSRWVVHSVLAEEYPLQ